MSNPYLVILSGMCLPTGVDYKFILLRSDMPDWKELAPSLQKFVKLITEDKIYSNEWCVLTKYAAQNHLHYNNMKYANIDTIRAESKALIADYEEWSAINNYLKRLASQDDFLAAYPQMKAKLLDYENKMFIHHKFFEYVLSFAIRMFLGHEQYLYSSSNNLILNPKP